MSGCRVYVGNLPFTVREDQIRHRFEEIGSVKEVSVPKDEERGTNKGFAFVEYFEHDVAAAAVRHINGQELEGRTLKVDFAGENRDSRSRGDRGNLRTKGRGPTAPAPPAVLPAPVAKLPSQLPVGAEKVAQAAARMAAQLGVQGPLSSAAQRQTNAALARMTPQELFQVMTQLRGLTAADPERTKKVLQDNPQLAMALYQVEVLLGMATTNPSSEQDAVLQQPAAPAALPVPNGQLRYPAAAAGMLLPTAVASHVVATQPTEMAALGPGGVAVPLQQQQQPQPQPQAVAAPGPGAAMVPMVPQVVQGSAPPHMEQQQQQQQQAAFHVQMIPQQPQPQPQQSMYAPTAAMQPPSQGLVVGGLPGAPGSLGMLAAPAAAQPAPGPAYPAAPLASGVPLGSAAPEAMQQAPPPAEALAAPAPGGSLMASGNYQEVLRKVLEMSQEQIDGLPPQHRDQVLALKQMHQGLQG